MDEEASRIPVAGTCPPDDQVATFRESICRGIAHLDLVAPAPFHGHLRLRRAGAVGIAEISSTPADYVRGAEMVGDGNSDLLVVLCRTGCVSARQQQLERRLAPGEGVVLDNAKAWQLRVHADSDYWGLQIPKSRLRRLIPGVDDASGSTLEGTALRLLNGYLAGTLADDLDDERAAALLGDHLVELTALLLQAKSETREPADTAGARAVHLAKVLHEIARRSAEAGLTAAALAAELGVRRVTSIVCSSTPAAASRSTSWRGASTAPPGSCATPTGAHTRSPKSPTRSASPIYHISIGSFAGGSAAPRRAFAPARCGA
jgi:hypothetical protein